MVFVAFDHTVDQNAAIKHGESDGLRASSRGGGGVAPQVQKGKRKHNGTK